MENYHFEDEHDPHLHDYPTPDHLHEEYPDLPSTSPRVEYNDPINTLSTIGALIFIITAFASGC